MAVGDHFQLTLRSTDSINHLDVQNVFAYEQTFSTQGANALVVGFVDNVLPYIAAILSNATVFVDIVCINLDDLSDYVTQTLGGDGDVGGDAMPPFVAFEFEYVRTTRAVNNGRKSFGLVPESSVANGVAVAGVVTALETLEGALLGPLTETISGAIYKPMIWRRPGTYSSGTVSAPGAFFDVADVNYRAISTQNTRKIGRGS